MKTRIHDYYSGFLFTAEQNRKLSKLQSQSIVTSHSINKCLSNKVSFVDFYLNVAKIVEPRPSGQLKWIVKEYTIKDIIRNHSILVPIFPKVHGSQL